VLVHVLVLLQQLVLLNRSAADAGPASVACLQVPCPLACVCCVSVNCSNSCMLRGAAEPCSRLPGLSNLPLVLPLCLAAGVVDTRQFESNADRMFDVSANRLPFYDLHAS
jgi:hypothetical protein